MHKVGYENIQRYYAVLSNNDRFFFFSEVLKVTEDFLDQEIGTRRFQLSPQP